MSEPPAKVKRVELINDDVSEMPVETNECEEWLSEGILTDDDGVREQNNSAASLSNVENTSQDESTLNSTISEREQNSNEAVIADMDLMHSQNDSADNHSESMNEVMGAAMDTYDFEITPVTTNDQQPSTSNQSQENTELDQLVPTDQQDSTTEQQIATSDQQITTIDQQVDPDQPQPLTDQQILSSVQIRRSTDENTDFEDLADDLSTFLIRKSDGAIIETQKDISDNDGNDTDELLRVLGDDDKDDKAKKSVNGDKNPPPDDSTDEDIFGTAKESNMKLAKDMVTRKAALKHRERSETDHSTDEDRSSRKKFKPAKRAVACKSTTKLPDHNSHTNFNDKSRLRSYSNKGVRTVHPPTPVRLIRSHNPTTTPKSLLKPQHNPTPRPTTTNRPTTNSSTTKRPTSSFYTTITTTRPTTTRPTNTRPTTTNPATKNVPLHIERTRIVSRKPDSVKEKDTKKTEKKNAMDEEFLEEDELGLNQEVSKHVSRINQDHYDEFDEPDSEFDDDSRNSYYTDCDELLSSAESDLEDWFTLDLRAERASEYLPLLGSKALEMLTAERDRVAAKLQTLEQSTLTLSNKGKQQTIKIKECRSTIDDLEVQLALV